MAARETEEAERAPVVVWLRQDLRLDDNPALYHAAATGRPVVALYVFEEATGGLRAPGAAHRWWLHHSLGALAASLKTLGTPLVLRRGAAEEILPDVARAAGATSLFVNRRYSEAGRAVDAAVEDAFDGRMERFDANLLHDPETIRTKGGTPFKVYGPFRRAVEARGEPRDPLPAPKSLAAPDQPIPSEALDDWALLPTRPDWAGGLRETWTPGEASARKRFRHFCNRLFADYEAGRERPATDETSRMSPHLHFGEISPLRLWHEATQAAARHGIAAKNLDRFRSELLWRDFSHHLLRHLPDVSTVNVDRRFDSLRWRHAPREMAAWREGLTGYPIVDAGLRQLWRIGWMHNRVRMIVGSFLTRDLLVHWKEGEDWFWDTLVDADLANNTTQWQWIAGTGADPQPFFRIFNPVAQSERFDPSGDYIRRYVPELAALPTKAIHAPWNADAAILAKAGVELGTTYPRPIVDHGAARTRALETYAALRAGIAKE